MNNYSTEQLQKFDCEACRSSLGVMRDYMILCSDCGNKRCPQALNHRYKCTGSNAINQECELKPEQKILPAIITTQLDPAKCHKVDPTVYDAPTDSPRDDFDAMSESHRSPASKCHEFPFDAELEVPVVASQHPHYFKDVSSLTHIDVYQVLRLYGVTDPCLQHIVKKALCAGKRGSKDFVKDVQEIADTANRLVEIEGEQGE